MIKIIINATLSSAFLLFSKGTMAQKNDTIHISGMNINSSVLKEGTHRYIVILK